MSGPVAIWATLESAVLENFRPASAYGGPALCGALAFSALYYAGRRRARGRRVSVTGFLRSTFPRRILLHPSSLIDMRLWALNAIVFASAYGMLGLRPVLLARRNRRRADTRIRTARAPRLASLDYPHARDRAAAPGLRTRLLVRPLRLSQDPSALGVPQGPPFRRGDDDPDRIAPAPGRDHRVHELDRARDRNRVWRHDLRLRSRRAPVHASERQHPHHGVSPDLRSSAAQQHVDRVHRRRRPDPAKSGPSPAASLRQSRPFRQEPRLCARFLGLGVRHARDPGEDSRTHRVWRRRRGAVSVGARRLRPPMRALCRPCAEARPKNRWRPRRRKPRRTPP